MNRFTKEMERFDNELISRRKRIEKMKERLEKKLERNKESSLLKNILMRKYM